MDSVLTKADVPQCRFLATNRLDWAYQYTRKAASIPLSECKKPKMVAIAVLLNYDKRIRVK